MKGISCRMHQRRATDTWQPFGSEMDRGRPEFLDIAPHAGDAGERGHGFPDRSRQGGE